MPNPSAMQSDSEPEAMNVHVKFYWTAIYNRAVIRVDSDASSGRKSRQGSSLRSTLHIPLCVWPAATGSSLQPPDASCLSIRLISASVDDSSIRLSTPARDRHQEGGGDDRATQDEETARANGEPTSPLPVPTPRPPFSAPPGSHPSIETPGRNPVHFQLVPRMQVR
ncbi:hypothetical protein CONLIGDRAFT_65176 [Coniochaeta ligniaria NRRL 30616]|uniref:Uncharacterized protein n=1 Tax=Coniochaeta ligniaria NRRL 30616 TaxID=1408157 RepID=A0A1J7J750_9PEZI|nr:hypothetical protein CONLIGDRAFT_65176 [Coniochaeta ligniaria NRRL 30616]